MLRSSAAGHSCQRQLSFSANTLRASQVRANSTSASATSAGADAPKRRRSIPLAQDFGGLIIPDAHSKPPRVARDAHRRLASLGTSTIASRLAGRQPGADGQVSQNQTRYPDHAAGQRRPQGQDQRRSDRTGGNRTGSSRPNNEGASRWAQPNNKNSAAPPRRGRRVQEEEPELTIEPKAENFTVNIGTDLDALFSSAPPLPSTPTANKAVKVVSEKAKTVPTQSLKVSSTGLASVALRYALQRQAGDYSLIAPRPIRYIQGDSIRTLGARGLAERMIRRKAEVGLKSKANAIEVVSKLTSKASQTVQV